MKSGKRRITVEGEIPETEEIITKLILGTLRGNTR